MSAAIASSCRRVSSFGIRHFCSSESSLNVPERAPAIVHRLLAAIAPRFIAVSAANRTDTLAIGRADPLHREHQQNLLPQQFFQLEPGPFVEAHLGFPFIDSDFIF